MKYNGERGNMLRLKLFSKRRSALLKFLINHLESSQETLVVFTPNAEQAVQAYEDESFAKTLDQADLLIPDGSGIFFAARGSLKEWIPGVDLVKDLLEIAGQRGEAVLVIGGRDYKKQATQIGDRLNLQWLEGHRDVTNPIPEEERAIAETIKRFRPGIVFVAFGAPWQEKWVVAHRQLLAQSGVKVAMVVGGAFDMLTGRLQRAPRWLRRLGLEWAYRLYQEPWRWRRQLRLVKFAWLVLSGGIKVHSSHS
jgi:N-acetylglucosaminyldiphosphoundecaprenol N-acetyl-beta-D-mannosaminyltransferase